MKQLITGTILFALVFGAADTVCAEARTYIGLSYNNIDYSETGFATVEPTALVFQLGHEFGRIFSIEGRFGGGMDGDNIAEVPDVELSVISLVGGYLKWQVPNEKFKPYFMLGYTSVDLELESFYYYDTQKQKSLSFGVGLDFLVSPKFALNLEYIDYASGETNDAAAVDIEITSTNFGFKYFF